MFEVVAQACSVVGCILSAIGIYLQIKEKLSDCEQVEEQHNKHS